MTPSHAHTAELPHVVATRVYFVIFGALLVLTAATVWVAFHDWGRLKPAPTCRGTASGRGSGSPTS